MIDADNKRFATIAGDTVNAGKNKFASVDDLAARLFRENLAYLRIGSFWNDAAANTLMDFGTSCYYADSVPKFSGNDYYEGAWDVGQHLSETYKAHPRLDALMQFTMNDRNGFIHGMLTSTASHKGYLKQSDVKDFTMQWLGVAYEYARTGQVTATSDATQEQAEKIFRGFIDTYSQLNGSAHDMCVSLKVSSSEASIELPHRRLRLRALGMMCHTLEDLWCPAHTTRTYHDGGSIPKNSVLAFCNYKMQNGNKKPMFGYHIPFDRYAASDAGNSTNWREALTHGAGNYKGTETLANVLDGSMDCLNDAHTYFNTLGMNETIACITQLFEYLYEGTAWDDGVRNWIDTEIIPTYFDADGQSFVCEAGRRCLHTPTFILAPLQSRAMARAYGKVGLSKNHSDLIAATKSFDAWQRGAHLFYSGKYNTTQSKYITSGNERDSIWNDGEGENRLVSLVNKLQEGIASLEPAKKNNLLSRVGNNGCHDMVSALGKIGGMLQDFSIDLTGSLRASDDETMRKLAEVRSFFASGLKGQSALAAAADEDSESFVTTRMALESLVGFEDGSYLIAVRDMDSLEASVMVVPSKTPGIDKLEEGLANLTITYVLETEFEDDLDYSYVVTGIDYSDEEENVFFATGTVRSVSEDEKGLVLDLNGLGELALTIREGASGVPSPGMYICAHYSSGGASLELVDYDELDDPSELTKVTYLVERVAGSSVLLLANGDESNAEDGQRQYLQIDYGMAYIDEVPLEGTEVTVYYHDEIYGETTDVDEYGLAASAYAAEQADVYERSEDDELTDSATTPGYLEAGDEYSSLNYGNDVFHVANVITASDGKIDDPPTPRGDNTPTPTANNTSSSSSPSSNPSSPSSSSTRPNTSSSSRSTTATPKTGDRLSGLNGLLSVAAVAGAAMTAYSVRRLENERRESSEK